MQDNVEELLELYHKLLGELQSPSLKKCIVPAAKELGQICLKSLLQRLGKLLVNIKNSKHLQKMWVQKQFGNNLDVEKRNLSVEQEEPFLVKIDQKQSLSQRHF